MGKFKRGGVWYGRVKDASGRWIAKTLATRDARVADTRYRDLERREADPAYRAAAETSLADGKDTFLTSRRVKGCAEDTIKMYEKHLGHMARLWSEDLPLAHIDAPRVDRYLATRLAEGAGRNTLGKELTTIRGLLRAAKRAKQWVGDVDDVLPDEWSTDYVPRDTALTPAQVTALVAVLAAPRKWVDKLGREYERKDVAPQRLNHAAFVAFLVATGARLGEGMRAMRPQVDLSRGLVHFAITKTRRKGKREKHVPVTRLTRPLLEFALGAAGTGRLFMAWPSMRRDLAQACLEAKVPRVSPNDLRRTHANWLVEAGVAANFVADVLGHVDSRMVEKVYGRLRPEQLRDRVREAVH